MRITSINLKNIGVFEDETIPFQPCPTKGKAEIHIFTGTNGSGKSTVLKALAAGFEQVAISEEKQLICEKNTNNICKYLRNKNETSGATLHLHLERDNIGNISIQYTGCPEGANHLHILGDDHKEIASYRADFRRPDLRDCIFDYALFAYSGYRLLDFSNASTHKKNPLYQSLEFVKASNFAFSIDNWIRTSLLKRSYAQMEGLKSKAHNYTDTIHKLEKAIGEIVGYEVKFKLNSFLTDPVIWYNNIEHDLEVLPDGLKSIISWLADLCMRLEALRWIDEIPIFDRNVILFLDEIEVHLHIEWQRKILPVIQKLLPNAQIFISTHSPFVVNSIDDAWIYNLTLEKNNHAKVANIELSEDGKSISYMLRQIFGVNEKFGLAVEQDLQQFYVYRDKALQLEIAPIEKKKMYALAEKLAKQGTELETIVSMELRQIERQIQKAQTT